MKNISNFKYLILSLSIIVFATSCQPPKKKLPIMGRKEINGKDTTYHTVPDFELVSHRAEAISKLSFQDKIYIVDDFFTSCPTICPVVKKNEMAIAEAFLGDDRVQILSISIDHRRDSVPRLAEYARQIELPSDNWHLTTGDKDHVYDILNGFFLIGLESEEAPGGFDHSGALILVDTKHRIRAVADGTDEDSVESFIHDIRTLLEEIDHE